MMVDGLIVFEDTLCIDHGYIDREDLFMKQSRDFTQEDRNIITHPVIDGLADVLGDEY